MKKKKLSDDIITMIASYVFNTFMIGTEVFFLVTFIKYSINGFIPFVVLNLILSLISYRLIDKKKLYIWTMILYFICQETMILGTVFLGMGYGFFLYCISMVSVAFYIYYIGKKLNYKPISPGMTSLVTLAIYFISYYISVKKGPVYTINEKTERLFFVYNSAIVFSIVISYMYIYMNTIHRTEEKLEKMATVDKLTGLYNRHYLLAHMDGISNYDLDSYWIAILDIDNFKKVNDVYGHNCGDYVLKLVSETVSDVCSNCTVCRWGGEEFIILASDKKEKNEILEKLRMTIENTKMEYDDKEFSITVTIGTQKYSSEYNTDQWISEADKKLYTGKNSGKNQVVY